MLGKNWLGNVPLEKNSGAPNRSTGDALGPAAGVFPALTHVSLLRDVAMSVGLEG
jgi:hypothetical protein